MAKGGFWTSAKSDSGKVYSLGGTDRPSIGSGGVDLFARPSALPSTVLSRLENVYLARGTADRRSGALKVARPVTPSTVGHSRTFGTTGKYATIPAHAALLIPAGGFVFFFHVTALRSVGGTTYVLSTDTDVAAQPILVRLSTTGVLTVGTTWDDASQSVIDTAALTDDSVQHGMLVFDAVAGTYTLYLNGAVAGTPVTGLSATLRPVQTPVNWLVGVTHATTYQAPFLGKIDSLTLIGLNGRRASSGTTTFVETLRRHSQRTWPSPQADFVRFHYDLDETSGTTMYDRSNNRNHGTYTGSPASTDPVALLSAPCNAVGRIAVVDGAFNYSSHFGNLFVRKDFSGGRVTVGSASSTGSIMED